MPTRDGDPGSCNIWSVLTSTAPSTFSISLRLCNHADHLTRPHHHYSSATSVLLDAYTLFRSVASFNDPFPFPHVVTENKMASTVSKRQQARNERMLQDLLKVPGNDRCADCAAKNPGEQPETITALSGNQLLTLSKHGRVGA